eukprot:84205-Amphidinium_carterae.1
MITTAVRKPGTITHSVARVTFRSRLADGHMHATKMLWGLFKTVTKDFHDMRTNNTIPNRLPH